MQGPNLLFIAFGALLVFAIILFGIAIHQDKKEIHQPAK